jgi:DNA-binding XRE family transcriptional regulator
MTFWSLKRRSPAPLSYLTHLQSTESAHKYFLRKYWTSCMQQYSFSCMTGQHLKQLRVQTLKMTQAELARALEVSPVTVNRWEADDPRYNPPLREKRLLEALDEIASSPSVESEQLREVLRASTVAGVVAKMAIGHRLGPATVALLAATPGLGWLGLLCGVGVAAALPFFQVFPEGSKLKPRQEKNTKLERRKK